MCTQSLCAEIVALCADIHRAEYRLLSLIEKLDAAKSWRHEAMPSCAHWLNAHCGLDLVTAREKVRIAHALPRLPLIRECFRSGELSYSKVRAITRVAGSDNEAELVQMARTNTAAHVARNVAAMRQAERLERIESGVRCVSASHVHVSHRRRRHAGVRRSAASRPGRVVAFRRSTARWSGSAAISKRHRRRSAAPMHSRFLQNDFYPNHRKRMKASTPRIDFRSLCTLPRKRCSNTAISADDPPQIEDGPVLASETLRRIACDSAIVRILESGDGEPLDIGRKTRVSSPALRRALKRRDRGCRFPNCTNTRFVDGHHIMHWADGGATRLDNLVLLCRHHHRLLHEGMYYVVKDGAQFIFCRSDGEEIPAGRDTPLAALIERARSRLVIAPAMVTRSYRGVTACISAASSISVRSPPLPPGGSPS